MHELRLLFAEVERNTFTVSLEDAPGHVVGVSSTLSPFLSDADFENLRWYLEEYMDLPDGGAVVRALGVEGQILQWRYRLCGNKRRAFMTSSERLI